MREWLSAAVASRSDHPFVIDGEREYTFGEISERVGASAMRLRADGVSPETVAGMWARNDVGSIVAMLALWRVGAVVQLVNTRLTASEASAQLRAAGAHVLVGSEAPPTDVPALDLDTRPGPGIDAGADIGEDRLAWIVFTSGSSGPAKGVRLTFGNLEASAAGSAIHLGHTPDDRWLCDLPLFHVGGASILVRSLRQATTVLLEPRFDPIRAAALLRAGDATIASTVATALARTLDVHAGRYSGVRAVLVGGGPVPFDLVEKARAAGLPALATYGMTETASQVATARLSDGKVVAMPRAEIRTVGGRIEVRGPMVSPGYIGGRERGPEEWFQTGDLGIVHDDGSLEVLGRADDVIISGGENVHPAEVEAVIAEHPEVRGVVVLGELDAMWGQAVVAVYEGAASPGELERHARYRLAGFKIPRRWVHMETMPRLSIGKVDRQAVVRMVLE